MYIIIGDYILYKCLYNIDVHKLNIKYYIMYIIYDQFVILYKRQSNGYYTKY